MGRKTHPIFHPNPWYSPYIFVLCMERLGHGIHNAVRDGSWKPIHLSRRGTPLTHLFFANDLLLLAEATCNQAKTINEILENFCSISGGKVNKEKTQILFSRNVKQATAKNIAKECGFSVTNNLGKYLGMSLLHNRVTKATIKRLWTKWTKNYPVGMLYTYLWRDG